MFLLVNVNQSVTLEISREVRSEIVVVGLNQIDEKQWIYKEYSYNKMMFTCRIQEMALVQLFGCKLP